MTVDSFVKEASRNSSSGVFFFFTKQLATCYELDIYVKAFKHMRTECFAKSNF